MDKVYSSPLHYPGGKCWLFEHLYNRLPPFKTMVSPFFGGGSVELNFAAHGVNIQGYDKNLALINFWHHWLKDAARVENAATEILLEHVENQTALQPLKALEMRIECLPEFRDTELLFWRAVYYYVFNRLSCMGFTYISKYIRPYRLEASDGRLYYTRDIHTRQVFPPMNHMRFCEYELLNIELDAQDFEKTLTESDTFAYCDPPYVDKEVLYDAKDFPHPQLASILKNRKNWVCSYNDVPSVHELYEGFPHEVVKMTSGFKKDGKRMHKEELVIYSPDVYAYLRHQPQQLEIFQ